MSACCNFWTCSLLKKVLNKLEDSYHTYVNAYKTHAMATHHGGTGQPLEKDSDPNENDTIQDEYHADINDFENVEPDHHERLRDLTHEIEHLWQNVEANETEPMDAINHLECKCNRLALTFTHLHHWNPLRRFCSNIQTLNVLHKRKHPL